MCDVPQRAPNGSMSPLSAWCVGGSDAISKVTRKRVVDSAKDDLARRADANSLARTRAARSRKSVRYPKGSVEYAQVVPEGGSSLGRLSPQQGGDKVNCGVYTLACFWALACGVSLSAIRKQDLARWRERFLVWLLDGGASLSL